MVLAIALGAPAGAQDTPEGGNAAPLTIDPGPRFVPESFAELADRLSPAVVNITTTTRMPDIDQGMRPVIPEGSPFEDFFRDFMERQPGSPRPQQRSNALGSGFIISPDGYIVTNNHVIESADEISVELFGGGELEAELVGRDPRTDIALLKVESEEGDLPFVEFGDSDAAKVGDWVLAIGNPLGQGFSVSAGIVSARNRMLQGSYDDFIQTDAAINRGNSGGPLFDMQGRVIGVNTAILSPTGGSIGIGFAMSSAVVERVVAQLRDFGETRRGWLGVRIQNVDDDVAEAIGLGDARGALVTDVPEGPALEGGIESGDVIVSFAGEPIEDTRELVRIVAEAEIGRTVEVVVFRDGAERTLEVEVGLLEEATLAAAPGASPDTAPAPQDASVLGMTVAALTDRLREEFGLDRDVRGLVVTGLDSGSDAYSKGIREGDVIAEVGQEAVAAPEEMRDRIEAAEAAGRNSILLLVRRDGQPRFVALNLSS
jgi:serine protease Do